MNWHENNYIKIKNKQEIILKAANYINYNFL